MHMQNYYSKKIMKMITAESFLLPLHNSALSLFLTIDLLFKILYFM